MDVLHSQPTLADTAVTRLTPKNKSQNIILLGALTAIKVNLIYFYALLLNRDVFLLDFEKSPTLWDKKFYFFLGRLFESS